jgi:hypothetical protein
MEGEGTTTETPVAPKKEPEAPKFGPVSYERFSEVNGAKRALAKEVEALRPKAAEADTLRAEVDRLKAAQASWLEERTILGAGIFDEPDEALDVARMVYGKLPEADRPAFTDWTKGLAAEGAAVPKPLQAYMRKPVAATATAPAPKVPAPKVEVNGKAPPSSPAVDPKQLAELRKAYQRTRSPAAFTALQTALNAVREASKKT